MTPEETQAYYVTVARRVGVPEIWLQDCVQEMRVACWLQGEESKTILRRTAIDFVRKYGPHSRGGVSRDYGYISGSERLARDFTDTSDRIIDLERALPSLTSKQRQAVTRLANGLVALSRAEFSLRYEAREKLRKAC